MPSKRAGVATPGLTATPGGSGTAKPPAPPTPPGAFPTDRSAPAATAPVPPPPSAPTSAVTGTKRSEYSTESDYANGQKAVTTSPEPLNYQSGGSWHAIDDHLKVASDGSITNVANSWHVSFSPISKGGVKIVGNDGGVLSFAPESPSDVTPTLSADGLTATYSQVEPGVSLRYSAEPTGVKESLILDSPAAAAEVGFRTSSSALSVDPTTHAGRATNSNGGTFGLSAPTVSDRTGNVVDAAAKPQAAFSPASSGAVVTVPGAGIAVGPTSVSNAVATAGQGGTYAVGVDPAWLRSQPVAAFPITIDPSVAVESVTQGNWRGNVGNGGLDCLYSSGACWWQTVGVNFRSYGRYDLTAVRNLVAQGAQISSGMLNISDDGAQNLAPASSAAITAVDMPTVPATVDYWAFGATSYGTAIGTVAVSFPGQVNNSMFIPGASIASWASSGTAHDLGFKADSSPNANYYWPQLTVYFADRAPVISNQSPSDTTSFTSTSGMTFSGTTSDPDGDSYIRTWTFSQVGSGTSWHSDWGTADSYTMPAGVLKWDTWYAWYESASDGYIQTNSPMRYFIVQSPSTSTVWQQGANPQSGFFEDVNLGNGDFFKPQTDVTIASVGPKLEVTRSYNSLDTRTSNAFGQGWEFPWDTTAQAVTSPGVGVLIGRADGRQEFYGQNPDGSYSRPLGSASTLTGSATAGWTLTDADQTVYKFSNAGQLSQITDPAGRSLSATVSGGHVVKVTSSVTGRSLNFAWTGSHITSVTTDAVTGQGVLQWNYAYTGNSLTDVYDSQNGLTAGTSPHTHYAYDSSGRMVTWANPKGNTNVAVTYDSSGRVATRADGATPTPDTVHYSYNTAGNPSASPPEALITTVTDARGNTSVWAFDNQWHLVRKVDEAGFTKRWVYDTNGFLTQIIYEDGSAETYQNAANGNVLVKTDRWGSSTWYTFDAQSRVLTSSTPLSVPQPPTTTAATDPSVATYQTATSYDAQGNTLTVTKPSPLGRITNTYTSANSDPAYPAVAGQFAPAGLLKTTFDAAGGVTTNSYDAKGDLTRVVDPAGKTTTYTYDELGRQLSKTEVSTDFPAGVTWSTTYDKLGRIATQTEPGALNAVTGVTHTKRTTNVYDANGNVTTSTDSDVTGGDIARATSYTYDTADRQITKTVAAGLGIASTSSETYDPNGDVITSTDALGRVYARTYDPRGLALTTVLKNFVADPHNAPSAKADLTITGDTYDAMGRKSTETDADGRVTTYAYGQNDQVTTTTLKAFVLRGGGTQDVVTSAATYDPAGNLLTRADGSNTRRTVDTYNAAGLKATEELDWNTTPTASSPTWVEQRLTATTYNAAGDPMIVTNYGIAPGAANRTTAISYNTAEQKIAVTVTNSPHNLTTSMTYDSRGLEKTTTDPLGRTTSMTYDALGRKTAVIAPAVASESNGSAPVTATPTTTTGYDTYGETTQVRDPNGNVTTTAFDAQGRQSQITYPSYTPPGGTAVVPTELFTYDAVGNLTGKTDRRGKTSTFTFDMLNRVWDAHTPGSLAGSHGDTYTRYDSVGNVTQTTDPTGAVVNIAYDMLNRVRTKAVVVRQPTTRTVTTTFDYDWVGDQTYEVDPLGDVTTKAFDASGDVTSVTDAVGFTTTTTFDAFGDQIGTQVPDGTMTSASFDQAGRQLTSTQLGMAGKGDAPLTTTYSYDDAGNRTAVTSPAGRVTQTAYDADNRVVSTTIGFGSPASATTQSFYDAAGNNTRIRNGRGLDTIITYQSWNLQESRIEPPATTGQPAANRTFTTSYDAGGLKVKDTQPGGVSITRTFDDSGHVLTEVGAGATGSHTYTYDLDGRRTSVSHPNATIGITYDDRGLVLSTTGGNLAAGAVNTANTYNDAGELTARTDAAGTATFTYDPRGLVATITDPLIGGTRLNFYDPDDRLVQTQLKGPGAASSGNQPGEYQWFDDYGRTTEIAYFNTNGCWVSGGTCRDQQFQYDSDGNVTAEYTDFGAPSGWSVYSYNAADQLVSWGDPSSVVTNYTYDGAGDRLTAGANTYAYDGQNRLTSGGGSTYTWTDRGTLASTVKAGVTTAISEDVFGLETQNGSTSYSYDGLGRVARRNGASTWFGYDDLGQNPIADGTWTTLTDGNGSPVSMKQTGRAADWVATDLHSDVVGLLNPGVTGTDYSTRYDPFGVPVAQSGTAPTAGFQSDWTDPSTGEIDMGARFYQPSADMFTSRDSTDGELSSPLSLNRYTYADDNPIANLDLDGHMATMNVNDDAATYFADLSANVNEYRNNQYKWYHQIAMNNHATSADWLKWWSAYDRGVVEPSIDKIIAVATQQYWDYRRATLLASHSKADAQNVQSLQQLIGIESQPESEAAYPRQLQQLSQNPAVQQFAAWRADCANNRSPSSGQSCISMFILISTGDIQWAREAPKILCDSAAAQTGSFSGYLCGRIHIPPSPSIHINWGSAAVNALSALIIGFFSEGDAEGPPPDDEPLVSEAGSVREVNPLGGSSNCVNCAIATDSMLGGAPASALDVAVGVTGQPISILEDLYGGSFEPVAGPSEIASELSAAGPGSRGIVFGTRGDDVGHVFNVVNQGGVIRFLDGQSGGVASLHGFDGFFLLRTN